MHLQIHSWNSQGGRQTKGGSRGDQGDLKGPKSLQTLPPPTPCCEKKPVKKERRYHAAIERGGATAKRWAAPAAAAASCVSHPQAVQWIYPAKHDDMLAVFKQDQTSIGVELIGSLPFFWRI